MTIDSNIVGIDDMEMAYWLLLIVMASIIVALYSQYYYWWLCVLFNGSDNGIGVLILRGNGRRPTISEMKYSQ